MTSPAWENLDDFLSVDDFAVSATFTRKAGGGVIVAAGIFDEPQFDTNTGEYVFGGGQPRFTCKSTDVATLKKHDGATVTARPGVAFELCSDPDHDGTGMAVVQLQRVYDEFS